MTHHKIKVGTLALLLMVAVAARAQFRVPPFDLEIKAGLFAFFDLRGEGSYFDYVGVPVLQGSLHIPVDQHIALGVSLSESFGGKVRTEMDGVIGARYPAAHRLVEFDLRLSTGRKARFRPYLKASYFMHEMYVDFGGFRLANDTRGYGLSCGAMIRLSHRISLIGPELSFRQRKQGFYFEEKATLSGEFKTGLIVTFSRRK